MTHAFPDTFGVAISTDQGYVVYTGEFIIDYDMMQEEYCCDLNLLSEFGKKGVLALLCESQGVERSGHTSPNHRITNLIEPIIESHRDGRILISTYFQSLFRIQEILDVAIKYRKKIFIHDDGLRHIIKLMEEMKYYTVPHDLFIDRKQFSDDMEDVLVIISGQGKNLVPHDEQHRQPGRPLCALPQLGYDHHRFADRQRNADGREQHGK